MKLPFISNWLRAKGNPASAPAEVQPSQEALNFCAPIDITAAEASADGKPKLPTFTILAYNGVSLNVGGFYLPVIVDLTGLKAAGSTIPILIDHDLSKPIGQADSIQIDAKGVRLSGTITGADADAQRVIAHAKNGFKWQASIGASIVRREILEAGKTAVVNTRTFTGPAIIARESVLRETSITAVGADPTTSASVAASAGTEKDTMNFKQWLQAKGFEHDNLTETQRKFFQAAYDAEVVAAAAAPGNGVNPAGSPGAPANNGTAPAPAPAPAATVQASAVTDMRAEMAGEMKRINAINVACVKHTDIAAKAIEEGWTAERAELEVLRASRPKAPAGFVISAPEINGDVLQAAVCLAGGLESAEKLFAAPTLEAAHKRFRGRIGLQELLLEAAWQGGFTGTSFRQDHAGVLRAAFSTLSLPGILSNTANKFLLQGYMHVEDAWRMIAATRPVNDFKTTTSYRLTGAFQFEKVGPDGELKHAETGEQSFTNKAETYGRMFAITRQDLINDDLGALTAIPQKIGRGAGLKINDVLYTAFLNNAAFFAAGNNNYIEGAGTVLGSAGLKSAVEKFRKQTDADGKPLGVTPRTLLVPPELEVTADELYASTNINTGGSSSTEKVPNKNVFAGKYKPVISTYLSNVSYSGYSATAFYLLADPLDVATIEVAFLNGQQQPTVESADADFNVLGIQMRGFFDFGVNKQDPRGGVKSKGAA